MYSVRQGLLNYAAQKLLCGPVNDPTEFSEAQQFAVLSQRLPLDVGSAPYITSAADLYVLFTKTEKQISNHMRVCVSICHRRDDEPLDYRVLNHSTSRIAD